MEIPSESGKCHPALIPAGGKLGVTTLATAEFATLRLPLLEVAACVIETAFRIRVAFASACPDAKAFRAIAAAIKPVPT